MDWLKRISILLALEKTDIAEPIGHIICYPCQKCKKVIHVLECDSGHHWQNTMVANRVYFICNVWKEKKFFFEREEERRWVEGTERES